MSAKGSLKAKEVTHTGIWQRERKDVQGSHAGGPDRPFRQQSAGAAAHVPWDRGITRKKVSRVGSRCWRVWER